MHICKAETTKLIKHEQKEPAVLHPFVYCTALSIVFSLSIIWIPEIASHYQSQDVNS